MSSRQCVRVSVGMWSSLGSPQLPLTDPGYHSNTDISGENQTLEGSSCHFNRTCPKTNYLTSTPPPPFHTIFNLARAKVLVILKFIVLT